MTANQEAPDIELSDLIASRETLVWKENAACVGKLDLFFNDHKQTSVRQAKAICDGCAVKTRCLEYALTHTEYGVWGGMTANERRVYRRNKKKKLKEKLDLAK